MLAILLLIPVKSPRAEDLTLQASVDRPRVTVGDAVTLTVKMSSEGLSSAPTPDLVVPDGFEVAGSTSSSSTSINIVNGAMTTTRSVSFIYTLRARREGSFVIGPARVNYEGKAYASPTIRVEVVKGARGRQTRPAPSAGGAFSARDLRQIEENLFILAEPDKRSVYVGEQVTLSYRLYTRFSLQNVHYGHLPTFTGFWAETLFDAQRLNQREEVLDGRSYNVALLKRVALFPTSAGKQTLEQLEVICEIPIRSRRQRAFGFDDFFDFDPFGQRQQVTVRSADVEIEVLPLPPGAPPVFNGAVGRFQIASEATPTTVDAGDPISLKVTVSGTGNLHAIPEPARPEGDAFRFYDPKASLETQKAGGRVGGRKAFEYVVIPQRAGEQRLPPFRLAYFDPEQKRYATVATEPIALIVRPGAKPEQPDPAPVLNREEVKVLGEDIRYIKPDLPALADQGRTRYRNGWFLALQALPILGFLGAFAYRRHRERLLGDVAYARRRRARTEAARRLSEARRLMKAGEDRAFYAEVYRALAQFLADRLNLPAGGMTAESAADALAAQQASPEIISEVKAAFGQCDLARFAPAQTSGDDMAVLYGKTEELIAALGREI